MRQQRTAKTPSRQGCWTAQARCAASGRPCTAWRLGGSTDPSHIDPGSARSTRQAEARTGVSHSEFSRIRQAKFSRFTIDRLMAILGLLGQEVELSVSVRPRVDRGQGAGAPHPSP